MGLQPKNMMGQERGVRDCKGRRTHPESGTKRGLSHAAFDILALVADRPNTLVLNSALDVSPRQALIDRPGEFELEYEVFAQPFPILTFAVQIRLQPVATAYARLLGRGGSEIAAAVGLNG
jgi:hypothetical protein